MIACRIVLTAAHCVCEFFDHIADDKLRANANCLYNVRSRSPTNQQTSDNDPQLNYLLLRVGDENWKKATPVEVTKAYVMATLKDSKDNVVLANGYDIGLIFPEYNDMIKLNLDHLRIPYKYALVQIGSSIYIYIYINNTSSIDLYMGRLIQ